MTTLMINMPLGYQTSLTDRLHIVTLSSPEKMSHLWKTAGNCVALFKKNLRAEFEANTRLRNASDLVARSYREHIDSMRNTCMFTIGSRAFELATNAMRASDASIRLALEMGYPSGLSSLRSPSLEKRLEDVFKVPQYYGGIRGKAFYGKVSDRIAREKLKTGREGALTPYVPSIMGRIWTLYSRIRSVVRAPVYNDLVIEEVENYLLPKVLGRMASQSTISHLCSEGGAMDVNGLAKEVRGWK